ncbi:O-antigen ligase family protein [Flavobacteriaceae bacterium]|nr:O-antigen ligase family protein [Flavobacteriaceae bacterium]
MKAKYLFLILYMSIGLVPYLGAADKSVSQILYLNLVNLSAIIYVAFILKKNIFKELAESLKNIGSVFFFLFFIWSSITLINSINLSESLSILGNVFTLLVSFIFLIYFTSKISNIKRVFFYIITSLLIIETASVIAPYLNEIINLGSPNQRGQIYRGYTGNINILAYILLIKFPFLVYFQITKQGNYRINFFLILLLVFIISAVFATRSAILSLFIITILMSLFVIYIRNKEKKSTLKSSFRVLFKVLIVPVFLGLIINNIQSRIFDTTSFQSRLSTLNNIAEDTSLSQRLRYYGHALKSFTEKPILGKGIGSWEYESIKYEKQDMQNYVVPYHAHNDFLELLAETGLLGVLFYFGIIFLVCFNLLKKILDKESSYESKLFSSFLIISFIVYLLDSSFNFPFARPIQQMHLLFLLAISINFLNLKKISYQQTNLIVLIILALTPISIYSSSRLLVSSQHQKIFLRQFNLGDYSTPSLEVIDKFEMKHKNLSATALPMSTIKGLYYLNNDKFREAVPLFKKGIEANPYLFISESFLGFTYNVLKMPDSALYYTKKAFDNMPKNSIHYANYINSLVQMKDSITIKNVYQSIEVVDPNRDPIYDQVYLLAMAEITDPDNTDFTLSDIDIDFQSGNDRLKKGYYTLKVGETEMYNADRLYQLGMYNFEQENYKVAIDFFIAADSINPYELVYKENAANSLIRYGDDTRALKLLNDLIDNFDSQSPMAYYLRGLILLDQGKKVEACSDLKYANDNGLLNGTKLYGILCLGSN